MKIYELFETMISPKSPGEMPTGGATTQPSEISSTNPPQKDPNQPPGTNPPTTTTLPAQQMGQPTGTPIGSGATNSQQQIQQDMKTTMTDLDKIAAQIVGLKQKQQQLQQKIQPTQ